MTIAKDDGHAVAGCEYEPFSDIIAATSEQPRISHFCHGSYIYDQECNLYYLQSRYYDSKVGRYLNHDVLFDYNVGIRGYNLFAYCGNSPVFRLDPNGRASIGAEEDGDPTNDTVSEKEGGGTGSHSGNTNVSSQSFGSNSGSGGRTGTYSSSLGKAVSNSTQSTRGSAVRRAWRSEVDLVQNTGKGTRDWTDAEIEELLATGKVKGYVGHHMKSVKGYPGLAGDPANIQFLTPQEHLQAHGGNWRNITHWRYEP